MEVQGQYWECCPAHFKALGINALPLYAASETSITATAELLQPTAMHSTGRCHIALKIRPPAMRPFAQNPSTTCYHRCCYSRENGSSDCPTCKHALDETQLFPDNYANREIQSLSVKCPNTKRGCSAVIELRNVQVRLSSVY